MDDFELESFKWGDPTLATTGGVVNWSFASFNRLDAGIQFESNFVREDFKGLIRSAFQTWENVADIDFVEVPDGTQTDIVLGYDDIDGPGTTLAHALTTFEAGTRSSIIFSQIGFDFEEWSTSESDLLYLFTIAVHEIGHSIGLGHSNNPDTIMYPFIGGAKTIEAGDIAGVQAIYGPGILNPEPPTPDLTATNVTVSSTTLSSGSSTTLTYDISNIGTGVAVSTTAGIYLSADRTISTTDTLLATQLSSNSNTSGSVDTKTLTIDLPDDLTTGTYYIGVVADQNNAETSESDETNNASSGIPITVTNPVSLLGFDAIFEANPDVAKGLAATYQFLLGGVPNQVGFTSLLNTAVSTNFGAASSAVFNSENIFINLLNNLAQGNDVAATQFTSITGSGPLSAQITALYNAIIPEVSRTTEGLAFFNRSDAIEFYSAVVGERGIVEVNGPAVVAAAAMLSLVVRDDITGLGNDVNDLFAAVGAGSSQLPIAGDEFTDVDIADGNNFDADDASISTTPLDIRGNVVSSESEDRILDTNYFSKLEVLFEGHSAENSE